MSNLLAERPPVEAAPVGVRTPITIKGRPYAFTVIAAEDPSIIAAGCVAAQDTGEAYIAHVSEVYGPHCGCPDFAFRHEGNNSPCKHLMGLLEADLLAPSDVALDDAGRVVGVRREPRAVAGPCPAEGRPARPTLDPFVVFFDGRRIRFDAARSTWVVAEPEPEPVAPRNTPELPDDQVDEWGVLPLGPCDLDRAWLAGYTAAMATIGGDR